MNYINLAVNKLISRFPSKQGKKALKDLQYDLNHGGIDFELNQIKDSTGIYFVAKSKNAEKKRIITSGQTLGEVQENIKDAIFTAYEIPSCYTNYDLISSPVLQDKVELKYATQ